jgi:hypothetical protein
MKCPVCWSEKAYRREVHNWLDVLSWCLLLAPFQCRHCFHKFHVLWFLTLGEVVRPPEKSKTNGHRAKISPVRRSIEKTDHQCQS